MNLSAFRARWLARREEFARFGAHVDGARLCDELLADLDAAVGAEADALLTLEEAARESHYSADRIGRLVREGTIPNSGRPHAPRVRRRDLWAFLGLDCASPLPRAPEMPTVARSQDEIARAVVRSFREATDG